MRGKVWSFIRPADPEKVMRFENTGETFSAKYRALRWLHANGYIHGSTDGSHYLPAMKGERYELPQKLYNFELEDYLQVTAVCYSHDYRDGWVEVWLVEPMYVLDLVVTHKWYDMILSGEKTEEYRDVAKWWKRIVGKGYTHVRFRRGYTSTCQILRIDGISCGIGREEWGAPQDRKVLIIRLGERYGKKNIKEQ